MACIPPSAAKKATGIPRATQNAILPLRKKNKTMRTNIKPVAPLSISILILCLTESAKIS